MMDVPDTFWPCSRSNNTGNTNNNQQTTQKKNLQLLSNKLGFRYAHVHTAPTLIKLCCGQSLLPPPDVRARPHRTNISINCSYITHELDRVGHMHVAACPTSDGTERDGRNMMRTLELADCDPPFIWVGEGVVGTAKFAHIPGPTDMSAGGFALHCIAVGRPAFACVCGYANFAENIVRLPDVFLHAQHFGYSLLHGVHVNVQPPDLSEQPATYPCLWRKSLSHSVSLSLCTAENPILSPKLTARFRWHNAISRRRRRRLESPHWARAHALLSPARRVRPPQSQEESIKLYDHHHSNGAERIHKNHINVNGTRALLVGKYTLRPSTAHNLTFMHITSARSLFVHMYQTVVCYCAPFGCVWVVVDSLWSHWQPKWYFFGFA